LLFPTDLPGAWKKHTFCIVKKRVQPVIKVTSSHPFQWLWESLEGDPGFVLSPLFGGRAVYLDGKLMLFFIAKEEPWKGVLVCTDRGRHAALIADFPLLSPHPVLRKWLYLPETAEHFETTARALVTLAGQKDFRMGVLSSTKKKVRTQKVI